MVHFLRKDASEEEKRALSRKWEKFFEDMSRRDTEKTLVVLDGPLDYSLDRVDKTASVACRGDREELCYEARMRSRLEVNGEEYIVNFIPMMAFKNCVNLVKVEIPETVDKILRGTFWDCVKLEQIFIPSNIKLIVSCAFFNCPELKKVEFEDLNGKEILDNAFVDCHPEIKFYNKATNEEFSKDEFIKKFCKESL